MGSIYSQSQSRSGDRSVDALPTQSSIVDRVSQIPVGPGLQGLRLEFSWQAGSLAIVRESCLGQAGTVSLSGSRGRSPIRTLACRLGLCASR